MITVHSLIDKTAHAAHILADLPYLLAAEITTEAEEADEIEELAITTAKIGIELLAH